MEIIYQHQNFYCQNHICEFFILKEECGSGHHIIIKLKAKDIINTKSEAKLFIIDTGHEERSEHSDAQLYELFVKNEDSLVEKLILVGEDLLLFKKEKEKNLFQNFSLN